MVKSTGLKSLKGLSLWQQIKSKNLNTETEISATDFTGSCPKVKTDRDTKLDANG